MADRLDERLIVIGSDASTAQECILQMSALLERYGYVRPGYGEAVIEREAVYPTGLPGKGVNVAIPHTTGALVNKPAIGVIIPKEPVTFSMMGSNDVQLDCGVIMPLVIRDPKEQIGLLKRIAGVISDATLLGRLSNARSTEAVLECLSVLDEDE